MNIIIKKHFLRNKVILKENNYLSSLNELTSTNS